MNREQYVKQLIKEHGLNIKDFSKKIDMPYSTLLSILNGSMGGASVDNIIKICSGLNITIADLQNVLDNNTNSDNTLSESVLLKKYRSLDQYGRKVIDTLLDLELERLADVRKNIVNFSDLIEESKKKKYTKRMRVYGKISAGLGVEAIEDYEEVYGPDRADFALIVDGDSMEPEFSDQQVIYIKKTSQFENGQIMAVQVEDDFFMQAYLKIVERDIYDDSKIRLISLNDKYEDQFVDAELLTVIGIVVE